ncbi:MAG TPA: hypothetical protein VJX30_08435 [Terriglobales bacterium]|nr:hypothetical protein [Terriglobales bacterium]
MGQELGFDPAGLDYLIDSGKEYYVRRQRDRTLKKGDRVAIIGRGIAVVEHADDKEIYVVLWNKSMLRIRRKRIVWDEGNRRWETDANAPLQQPAGELLSSHVRTRRLSNDY